MACRATKAGQGGQGVAPYSAAAVPSRKGATDKPKLASTDPWSVPHGLSPSRHPAVRKAPAGVNDSRPRCRLRPAGFCHPPCSIDGCATPQAGVQSCGLAWGAAHLGQCTGTAGLLAPLQALLTGCGSTLVLSSCVAVF